MKRRVKFASVDAGVIVNTLSDWDTVTPLRAGGSEFIAIEYPKASFAAPSNAVSFVGVADKLLAS